VSVFTMAMQAQTIVVTAFGVVMAAAAIEDFRRLIIPNMLPIMLVALWPIYFAAVAPSFYGALAAMGCAVAVFIGGAILFSRGLLGGGDVKLLSAATLWAGPSGTLDLLLWTGVLGGALALFLLHVGPAADHRRTWSLHAGALWRRDCRRRPDHHPPPLFRMSPPSCAHAP
jgi:prepilin peptidase CpaA